jgi:hypothetical protein
MPTEDPKPEESKTIFHPVEEVDPDFDPDPSSCGLTPEMLKEAIKIYEESYASRWAKKESPPA